jgi:ribonuclease G
MHVVDVNSGRSTSEHEQEKSAFRNNMEALKAVAKQLRLRDIGGMIIIDFIDMMLEENRKKLYNEMRRELSKDRAKTVVYPITQLGLLQITRQRIRQAISERLTDTCTVCDGAGRIRSRSVILHSIERWLTSFRAQNLDFSVELIVHPSMAEYLTEGAISRLSKLMIKHFVKIKLDINDNINPDEFTFVSTRTFRDITSDYL